MNQSKAETQQATLNPAALCPASRAHCGRMWAPEGLCNPQPTALLVAACVATLLHWLFIMPVAFFSRCCTLLASPSFWGPYCSVHVTLRAVCLVLLGAVCRNCDLQPTIWPLRLPFDILAEASMTITLTFCIPVKPASCG